MAPGPTGEELERKNLRLEASVDELRAFQEKYLAIFNHGFNCVYIHDLEGNFLDANDAALKLLGYNREEISGLNFTSLIGEDQLPKAFETVEEIKRTGYESQVVEYELTRKDGSRIWIDTGGSLIYENGIPMAVLGVARDITARKQAEAGLQQARSELENRVIARTAELTETNRRLEKEIEERKKTEEALRESEVKFRALADSAPAATVIIAGEKILYVNPAFMQITGYMTEEALAMHFWDVVHPDMQELVKERGLARQQGASVPARYEVKALTKDGQTKWMDMAAVAINYGGRTATLAVAYDITERKQAEETLIAREQELESQTRDLEDMNAALKVLLKKREDDKVVLEKNMLSNVAQLVEPYLQDLKHTDLSDRQAILLEIIKTNLTEILTPFVQPFSALRYKLTPKEIQIANLIKQGKTNKEIAEIIGLSVRTIEFHRSKIRSKFGLKNGKDNLQAHLIAFDGG